MSDVVHLPPPPAPDLPIARKLAFAVIALGQLERALQSQVPVILPLRKAQGLGDLLMEAGEELLTMEPRATYEVQTETPMDRFANMVRAAAKELQAMAPQKPRIVRADGRPV